MELVGLGIQSAVISPGSRSSALAISADIAGMNLTIQLDERVAAFYALGQAKATGVPSVLICTSGTAGANYLPAIVEANHAGIPLIVCTADRPPELRYLGAGQTVDQQHLYGSHVRWSYEVPVVSEVDSHFAGVLALRSGHTAVKQCGPVHLNWPFREPLETQRGIVAPSRIQRPLKMFRSRPASGRLQELGAANERGLIVVGPAELRQSTALEVSRFARQWGWPIIADPASGLRCSANANGAVVVTTAELLLASPVFLENLEQCEAIVRVGNSPTSKAFRIWLESTSPEALVLVNPGTDWADPTGSVTEIVSGPIEGAFAVELDSPRQSKWLDRWASAESRVRSTVNDFFVTNNSELAVVRWLIKELDRAGQPVSVMASNSMPVRALDLTMPVTDTPLMIYANRGASGIDGVVATASGIASTTDERTFAIVGDVAAIHDFGGLAAATRLGIDNLTVLVIDNDGGGIFSFLPIAESIDRSQFDHLFTTPHGTDIGAIAQAIGFDVFFVNGLDSIVPEATGRPQLLLFATTAEATIAAVEELRDQVNLALMSHCI